LVYPNPANNELHVNHLLEATNYRVLNMLGTPILQGSLQVGNNSIATSSLPLGMYILELLNSEGIGVVRIEKE
jgi:hypothetical protein